MAALQHIEFDTINRPVMIVPEERVVRARLFNRHTPSGEKRPTAHPRRPMADFQRMDGINQHRT